MNTVVRHALLAFVLLAIFPGGRTSFAQPAGELKARERVEVSKLIDEFQEFAEVDFYHFQFGLRHLFLPLVSHSDMGHAVPKDPASVVPMREIVKRGAAAIPQLIAHLDDGRPTKMKRTRAESFRGLFFIDDYDYNRRVAKSTPVDVNRAERDFKDGPEQHTVTVGDMCFVALGQIVNREFRAFDNRGVYGTRINSPSYSQRLRQAIKTEWGTLTAEQHRERLKRDFVEPDHGNRRLGACLRLGYYYPEELEPLVLAQLKAPRIDVDAAREFIDDVLYPAKDAGERKKLFDTYQFEHGERAWRAVHNELFADLNYQEFIESRDERESNEEKFAARECLVELFGYPMGVKGEDRPRYVRYDLNEHAGLIDALLWFPSPKIIEAVRQTLHSTDDRDLSLACARYLAGRGADTEIEDYVNDRWKRSDEKRRTELKALRSMLGWTTLHAAVSNDEDERAETLIKMGAKVNAAATDGRTPLHVVAELGRAYGCVKVLLDAKANPRLKDRADRAPIDLVDRPDEDPVAELLAAAGADPPTILVAAAAGRADAIGILFRRDETLLYAKANGLTPLHLAAERGHVEAADTLLTYVVDVNATQELPNFRTQTKLTPLHLAAMHGHAKMVALLLSHKADRKAKSTDGKTALDYAKEKGDQETIRLLQE